MQVCSGQPIAAMIDMNGLGCYPNCKGMENHLHVYLYKGNPAEDKRPLDPAPFLPQDSDESAPAPCECSSTSYAVELRVSFPTELTASMQTSYRQAIANTADVNRDEVSISADAGSVEGDELSEPVRRVASNASAEFDTIVAAANNRHPSSPAICPLFFLLLVLVLVVLLV